MEKKTPTIKSVQVITITTATMKSIENIQIVIVTAATVKSCSSI
ncbi:MAG: hypothetical protein ACJAWN_001843 [Neolewinella sp.]